MAGTVFVNPGSGRTETSTGDMARVFPGARVVECDGDGFEDQVREAVDAGAAYVAVAGGDGTMRGAAQVLTGGETPLAPVPAGTRNHFAKDVGLPDFDAVADAVAGGHIVRIDTGEVNGMVFVNNASIGLYPKIVTSREVHQRRLPKGAAHIVAAWEQLRRGRRVVVEVEGEPYRAWLVFVGNGAYGEGLLDLADRETLTDGILDVRIVRADAPMARMRIVGALLLGRLARSPLVIRRRVPAITINVRRRRKVQVALDGEVTMLDPPLRFVCRPASLPVFTPPPG